MGVYLIVKDKNGEVIRAETTKVNNVSRLTEEYLEKGYYVQVHKL